MKKHSQPLGLFIYLLLMLTINACARNIPSSIITPPTASETMIKDTVTPTVIPAKPTKTPIPDLQQLCNGDSTYLSEDSIRSGSLVFVYTDSREGIWVTEDVPENSCQILPIKNDPTLHVSPDNTHLVYTEIDTDPPRFSVLSIHGNDRRDFIWQPEWPEPPYWGISWFTNKWLGLYLEDCVFLVSPITGKQEGYFKFPELPDLIRSKFVYYEVNESLTRIAYQDEDFQFAMRDLDSSKVITRINTELKVFCMPSWSPDGTLIAFEGFNPRDSSFITNELYIVDHDGNGGRVSNFSSHFKDFLINPLQWSPNQRYMAMWAQGTLHSEDLYKDQWKFYVFDINSGTLLDYCVVIEIVENSYTSFDAIWSPDSSQVYIRPRADIPGMIIDVQTGKFTQLPLEMAVMAWGNE